MKKMLYLPLETKSREFPGKLLLASFAAEAGFEVLLGNRVIMNKVSKDLPNGIYFYNATMPPDVQKIKEWKEKGHKVVVLDEEGLLFENEGVYKKRRLSQSALHDVNQIFAWGQRQENAIKNSFPDLSEKIIKVGNPRIDLLHKKVRGVMKNSSDELIKKFGKFVLINTNFANINNFNHEDYYREMYKEFGYFSKNSDESKFDEKFKNQERLFQAFKDMIKTLSKDFSNINFIIRPHPSESLDGWRELKSQNVHIIREGNVHEWILASVMVIHNSCTTGLEAFLLNKPVIAYVPHNLREEGINLPNKLSIEIEQIETLKANLNTILEEGPSRLTNDDTHRAKKMELIKNYIKIYENELSSEKIVNHLLSIAEEEGKGINRYTRLKIGLFSTRNNLAHFISKFFKLERSIDYVKSKFPSIKKNDVKILEKYKRELDNFDDVSVQPISKDLLLIKKQK